MKCSLLIARHLHETTVDYPRGNNKIKTCMCNPIATPIHVTQTLEKPCLSAENIEELQRQLLHARPAAD